MADPVSTPSDQALELVQAQLHLYRVQAKWEPWKALAAIVAGVAIFAGSVLALSNWIGHPPQTVNVHLDAPLTLAVPR